jgi:Tfp pilus assembly protein PilF
MAKVTIALREALRRAVTAYNGGKFSEAEALCHAIIAAKHDFFDAMHLLAVVQARLGRSSDASASFGRALAIRPLDGTTGRQKRQKIEALVIQRVCAT